MGSMGIIKLGSIELQLSRAQIGKAPRLLAGVYIIYHNILTSNIDKLQKSIVNVSLKIDENMKHAR